MHQLNTVSPIRILFDRSIHEETNMSHDQKLILLVREFVPIDWELMTDGY